MLVVRLPGELLATLRKRAAADRRPVSQYVRLVLEDHIKAKRR